MLVSITPLGSTGPDPAAAALQVVRYVESKIQASRRTVGGVTSGVEAYYADSVEGPGRWIGSGCPDLDLFGRVRSEQLRQVLLGQHPATGEPLAPKRRKLRAPDAVLGSERAERGLIPLTVAAQIAGVSDRYLRNLATRTQQVVAIRTDDFLAGRPLSPMLKTFLVAHRDPERGWMVERSELDRYVAARKPSRTIIGYDVTFSCPKSLSILWATGTPAQQDAITASVDAAVEAGLRYLESVTKANQRSGPAIKGFIAAAFTHGTSRNLDPQLHVHAIVSTLVKTTKDQVRPLAGRDLFFHAKTAGYLAGAELRHQTAERLGLQWGRVHHGLADIVGVTPQAIREMSSRRQQIETLASEMGVHSAAGHQVAAYRTRTAKAAVAPGALRAEWDRRLEDAGLDEAARAACFGPRWHIPDLTGGDRRALTAHLVSPGGVTEHHAMFDRRDVIQAIAEWANDRLTADEILDVADTFLTSDRVVKLKGTTRVGLVRYSTPAMLEAERTVLDGFANGLDRGLGVVPTSTVDEAIACRPSIGTDQAQLVREICTSGDQFQCVVGPAGSGKTFALDAARDAWQRAGYQVIGAADQGSAAETLGRGAGIRAETLEYWLTVLDTHSDPTAVFGPRTVMLVDEASTVGTRSLARLVTHACRGGAIVRLIGDPAQHSAVTAGGAFRELTVRHANRTPHLYELRRQHGSDQRDLRLALTDYRQGLIREAIDRLVHDDRVVLAPTADELMDKLVADWWVDREQRRSDPHGHPSSMVAEHHRERRALNDRARLMLEASGELHGPTLTAGIHEFRAGDEVVCRTPAKQIHPPGAPKLYIRNGTRGTVLAVRPESDDKAPGLMVKFENRDPVHVPIEFLQAEIRPGVVGGLTHSYAVTSHAAQGQTFEAARTLATDASSRPAIYVGLTRGRTDTRLYAVRRRDLVDDAISEDHMPRVPDEKTALQAIADRLSREQGETLASTHLVQRASQPRRARSVPRPPVVSGLTLEPN